LLNMTTIKSLRDLPRDIAPARDLWPAIEAQIAEEGSIGRLRRWRRLKPTPGQLGALAAALASLAIGIWVGRTALPGGTPQPVAQVPEPAAAMPVAYVNDPRYTAQRAAMIRALEAQLVALPPETQARVAASLATIRKSMQDIQNALGRDPGNALLQELLVDTYQEEMRVLTAVQEASSVREEI